MNTIPIVFCFDDNLEMPAGVCLTSLLVNAKADTFYDIFILHSNKCSFQDGKLNELPGRYGNCKITYRSVGSEFENAFEIRGITVAAYYRLLIPEIIPEYDKIIYSDVDVIFRNDLSQLYETTDLTDFYVAGVVSVSASVDVAYSKYLKGLGLNPVDYIYSGNLLINSKQLREDGIVPEFIKEVNHSKYKYQDMDIINIVCKGKIIRLPPVFCMSVAINKYAAFRIETSCYTEQELAEALKNGIIHYNGAKPWKQYCPHFDIWWEYYRKSIFFDQKYYFDFFVQKMHEYDLIPLWERVKILLRLFIGLKKK
jgi:lipopolysaccharide biosynthesis glycosyltransferase